MLWRRSKNDAGIIMTPSPDEGRISFGYMRSFAMLRMTIALYTFMVLTACGFTPVYQQQGKAREELAAIAVETPRTREGQWLKAALEDTIAPQGQSASPRYRLAPNFSITLEPLSIESDGTTRRYRMLGVANLSLTDMNGKEVYASTVQRFSSYHISEGDYSTYVAGKDASHQLITAVAEEIRLRLISFLARSHGGET
jgi:hypothetical protein